MTRGSRADLEPRVAAVRDHAERLAAGMAAARAATSPAIERATLRFLGVQGLDARGEPLAAAVVERFGELRGDGPGKAIDLAMAAAAAERDLGPQETALAVTAGEVDLADQAASLERPAGRLAADQRLARWTADAYERIDANRTARHELSDGLGVGERPWLGARLASFGLADAIAECREFVTAGADVVIVRVPPGREFARSAGEPGGQGLPIDMEPPPAGSQRGLAGLRAALDEAAAERGAYVSLATMSDGLAAPEQALVAGFERADLLFLDPFDEIALGVEPERAFADHAAAHRFVARSGAILVLGPGPLLAGSDLERGEAVGTRTRIGRSIAAQAGAVAWARASGLASAQVMIQAPSEAPASADEASLLVAELAVRHMVQADLGFVISEPADSASDAWRLALPLSLLAGRDVGLVVPRGAAAEFRARVADARTAVALAGSLSGVLPRQARRDTFPFSSEVFALARELVDTAAETLTVAESQGWAALVGGP